MQSKLKPALIGGVLLGIMSAVPLVNLVNCACCAWVIGGGLVASYLYFKDGRAGVSPWGDSILLGLLTGVIGAATSTLITIPLSLLGGGAAGLASAMEELRGRLAEQGDVPPQLDQLLGAVGGAGIGCVGLGLMLGFSLVIYSIFATVGSLIGAALFAKK
jgi:hypothetical protein